MKFTHAASTPALAAALAAVLTLGAAPARAVEPEATTSRIVVQFRDARPAAQSAAAPGAARPDARSLSARAQLALGHVRDMAGGRAVYALERALPMREARVVAARLALDPAVLRAEPDVRVRPHAAALPDDPRAHLQWALLDSAASAGGGAFLDAWPFVAPTAPRVTVAVLDTGTLPHPDVTPRVLPGHDLIADLDTAADGDARDADATDPGYLCTDDGSTSHWHGLAVQSLIAATAGNGQGIAGAAGNRVDILPVRVLGKCGGWLSDISDGLRWAAGAPLGGVPLNATPAAVVNLSLGGAHACPWFMQDAVDEAIRRNVVVVAAAGNEAQPSLTAPANCHGVIAVGAHTASGDLASYSNRATGLALTAPAGGACLRQTGAACNASPVVALGNAGGATAGADLDGVYFNGTSAAAPHAAAAAALVVAAHPQLTPAQVASILKSTARRHAADSWCVQPANAGACGAGMLDARAAVAAAAGPALAVTPSATVVGGGETVTLSVAVSNGAAPFVYRWTQVAGEPVALLDADTASMRFVAPATRQGSPGGLSFALEVDSAYGATTRTSVQVQVDNAPVFAPLAGDTASAGAPYARTLAVSDADDDPLTVSLVSGPPGASLAGRTLSWPLPAPGTWRFVVLADDGARTSQLAFDVTVSSTASSASAEGGGGAPAAGSGGGGGALGLELLLALAALAPLAAARRRARRTAARHATA